MLQTIAKDDRSFLAAYIFHLEEIWEYNKTLPGESWSGPDSPQDRIQYQFTGEGQKSGNNHDQPARE